MFVQVRPKGRERAAPAERRLAGETLVEHTCERVDVAARLGAALDLLGRRVFGRPLKRASVEHTIDTARDGEAEVGEVDVLPVCLAGREEDVPGLDITVEEIGSMRRVERTRRLLDDVDCPLGGSRPSWTDAGRAGRSRRRASSR